MSRRPTDTWQIRLLMFVLPDEDKYSLSGDFLEIHNDIVQCRGKVRGAFYLWKQILRSVPHFISNTIYWSGAMLKNYLKVALRNIKKYKGYSFTNIAGLAIGMAVCILIFLWVQDELSYDRFHENADRLCRVVEQQHYTVGEVFPVAVTPCPLAEALVADYPEIVNSTRMRKSVRLFVKRGDRRFYESDVFFADPTIFSMFTFPFIKGDPDAALDKVAQIVMTERMAEKYFGGEDPIGQNLILENQMEVMVTGVIENVPTTSHLKFDFLIPVKILEVVGQRLDVWGNNNIFTYVQLAENTDFNEADEKIRNVIKERLEDSVTTLHLQPLTRIHLHSDYVADLGGHGDIKYVYIFSIIALFVLIIACINFINLTTARSGNRAKEVGMRKVSGASRIHIIRQFLGESIFLAVLSFILAVMIVLLFLPSFNGLSGKSLTLDVTGNLIIPLGLIITAVLTGILSGGYPAIFLSSFRPVKVLKGMSGAAKRSTFRKILVTIQFTMSVFLIIAAAIVRDQVNYIQNKKMGYSRENIVYSQMGRGSASSYIALKNQLLQLPEVMSVSVTAELPMNIVNSTAGVRWPGRTEDDEILIHNAWGSHDYFKTFDMEFAQGRPFSISHPTDSGAFIINERALEVMNLDNPLETSLTMWGHTGPIIGVVKNFHFKSLSTEVEPLVFRHAGAGAFSYLVVRLREGDLAGQMKAIENVWANTNPDYPFDYGFIDDRFDRMYRAEQRMGKLFDYFTVLAIFIACLGLLGLASFMAEQRTKEIGIRKVLGASVGNVVYLMSKEFMILVAISNVIAWPLAFYFMKRWLENYAYHTPLNLLAFVLAAILAMAIAMVTVSFQAIKAARVNPVNSLKYE